MVLSVHPSAQNQTNKPANRFNRHYITLSHSSILGRSLTLTFQLLPLRSNSYAKWTRICRLPYESKRFHHAHMHSSFPHKDLGLGNSPQRDALFVSDCVAKASVMAVESEARWLGESTKWKKKMGRRRSSRWRRGLTLFTKSSPNGSVIGRRIALFEPQMKLILPSLNSMSSTCSPIPGLSLSLKEQGPSYGLSMFCCFDW